MRITNKIIQNNNLNNINTNKIYQDRLSTQMSTQKKVNRPSDDPVVAIRALRLRGSVSEVTQYYSKNIPDAESWLEVTEGALKNLTEILTDMRSQCVKGANGDLTSADREIVLEQLKSLGEEVYATGDADYAGRYVFTGHRTSTSLSFPESETLKYKIKEQLDSSGIDTIRVIKDGNLTDLNSGNYASINIKENDVEYVDVYRIRLAYNDCDTVVPPTIKYIDENNVEQTLTASVISSSNDPYSQVGDDPTPPANEKKVVFVPETGEVLVSKDVYTALMTTKDDTNTSTTDEGEIRVSYEKSNWQKGDLRPEHYFACESTDGTKTISYNASYLDGKVERQNIEYDVGFNQTIRINSTADECFNHGIGREVDDLVTALQDVVDTEKVVDTLKDLLKFATGADKTSIESRLNAAQKSLSLKKDKTQKMFEGGITAMQGYLDSSNLCITNCGTRSSKLQLIENRMQSQKTTFETLKSNNEDVDITEVVIQLGSAELTYQAALMATGKVTQTTLLNYI